jgi:hypothetical protein
MSLRLLVLALMLLSGCYRLQIRDSGSRRVLLNSHLRLQHEPLRLIRHFYREVQLEYVFGYNEAENRLVKDLLDDESKDYPGADIINLRIERRYRPLDAVAAVLTLGFFVRGQLILEGDLILPRSDAHP